MMRQHNGSTRKIAPRLELWKLLNISRIYDKRSKIRWEFLGIDGMVGRQAYIEEEVKASSRRNYPYIADLHPFPLAFKPKPLIRLWDP